MNFCNFIRTTQIKSPRWGCNKLLKNLYSEKIIYIQRSREHWHLRILISYISSSLWAKFRLSLRSWLLGRINHFRINHFKIIKITHYGSDGCDCWCVPCGNGTISWFRLGKRSKGCKLALATDRYLPHLSGSAFVGGCGNRRNLGGFGTTGEVTERLQFGGIQVWTFAALSIWEVLVENRWELESEFKYNLITRCVFFFKCEFYIIRNPQAIDYSWNSVNRNDNMNVGLGQGPRNNNLFHDICIKPLNCLKGSYMKLFGLKPNSPHICQNTDRDEA